MAMDAVVTLWAHLATHDRSTPRGPRLETRWGTLRGHRGPVSRLGLTLSRGRTRREQDSQSRPTDMARRCRLVPTRSRSWVERSRSGQVPAPPGHHEEDRWPLGTRRGWMAPTVLQAPPRRVLRLRT